MKNENTQNRHPIWLERQNQGTECKAGGNEPHLARYHNLSSKIESTKQRDDEAYLWDKRFIEYNSKARIYELTPKPDLNYLKSLLDSQKDER